jgi:hypothetical protein
MIDRLSDGLKVVGSGNTAGLIGMVAALNTIKEEHVHTVLLLKPTAIIFAIGIFLFAGGYLFLMYAYIYTEHYVALLYPNDEYAIPDDPNRIALANGARDASTSFMKRATVLALASTFLFFLGFVVAFVALVRY